MTPSRLSELKELAEKATAGPWKWWTSNSWRRLKRDSLGITQNVLEPYVCRDGHPDLSISEEDMDFIAAARTAVPELVAEVERLREVLRRWENHGCPDCRGDCAAANPPVSFCIMQETRAALGGQP